jgi:hypothetical protein
MRGLLHIRKRFGAEDRGVVDADGHLIAEFYHHVDENYFEDAEANAQEYVALRAEVERLRAVIDDASHELGVPVPGTPAPVANAARILLRALGHEVDDDRNCGALAGEEE